MDELRKLSTTANGPVAEADMETVPEAASQLAAMVSALGAPQGAGLDPSRLTLTDIRTQADQLATAGELDDAIYRDIALDDRNSTWALSVPLNAENHMTPPPPPPTIKSRNHKPLHLTQYLPEATLA